VIDVGGGSTEVSLDDTRAVSLDLGCVRATERWLTEGAIPPLQVETAQRAIDAAVSAGIPRDWPPVADGVAVAGTATTLAALDLGLAAYDAARIDGHRLTRAAMARERARLAPLTLGERRAVPAIELGRAPVIVGGILVLEAVVARLGLEAVTVSERDILHGIALLAAGYADV
jgi:exopolyphosphatase / guanosine-5'-triphosphate,3'-diphosphate pyrophosphatase